jgi:hypothetical protein
LGVGTADWGGAAVESSTSGTGVSLGGWASVGGGLAWSLLVGVAGLLLPLPSELSPLLLLSSVRLSVEIGVRVERAVGRGVLVDARVGSAVADFDVGFGELATIGA